MDPGLHCTAIVLTRDHAVKEAVSFGANDIRGKTGKLVNQYRVYDMSLTLHNTIQGWINKYEMKTLYINMEMPILSAKRGGAFVGKTCAACGKSDRGREIGVTTLMTQMRMIAVYQNTLFDLEGAEILLGEVNPSTAKMAFTGRGDATKDLMVSHSVWAKRPDIKDREDLADAQGIAYVLPAATVKMHGDDRKPRPLRYSDGAVGIGPDWTKKKNVTLGRELRDEYNRKRRKANKEK